MKPNKKMYVMSSTRKLKTIKNKVAIETIYKGKWVQNLEVLPGIEPSCTVEYKAVTLGRQYATEEPTLLKELRSPPSLRFNA